jgi:mono/diheme cytochrome c family protein
VIKFLKYVFVILLVLVVLAGIGITATIGWRPVLGPQARALTNRHFDATPERLQRGKYIAENATGCMLCHSPMVMNGKDSIVTPEDKKGAGQIFPGTGLPGRIVASNLTPDRETGVGNWTDDELARAIREGVGKDGRALFPLMPYRLFRNMSDEDLASVIVYLRSLAPVHNPLPKTEVIFPVKYFIRVVPQPVTEAVQADLSTPVSRGKYLVEIGSCIDCHTPRGPRGAPVPGIQFAGGPTLEGPWGKVASANITPDRTGIGYYTPEMFVQTIRTGAVGGLRKLNPVMPWEAMRGMTDEDLNAMFAYLQTLKPVEHYVNNVDAPTLCKKCKLKHGLGSQN